MGYSSDVSTSDQPTRTRITAQLRALRFDAGSVSLNLVATVGRRGSDDSDSSGSSNGVERLTGVARLREWCAGVGISLRAADQTAKTVAALHSLRAAAYDVVTSVLRDRLPDKASVASINAAAAVAVPAPRLIDTHVVQPAVTGDELLSLLARDLLDVLAEPSRLRECASQRCRMVYLESPGARARKWCSMRRCGNQAKAQQHRSRAGQVSGG